MATTTNYSWTTPDDTALVKDGAAAIRTLGSSIDTTTKALNPSTTLGDIEYRSATANTNTRLGIGTSGQALIVSGGVPAWGTIASGGMTTIASGTLSSTAVTISSIPSTYNHLVLEIGSPVVGTDAQIIIRPNASATTYHGVECRNVGTAGTVVAASTSGITTSSSLDDNTANDIFLRTTIFNYASTTDYKIANLLFSGNRSSGEDYTGIVTTAFRSTSAVSSLEISANAETFSSGTYTLYGVK